MPACDEVPRKGPAVGLRTLMRKECVLRRRPLKYAVAESYENWLLKEGRVVTTGSIKTLREIMRAVCIEKHIPVSKAVAESYNDWLLGIYVDKQNTDYRIVIPNDYGSEDDYKKIVAVYPELEGEEVMQAVFDDLHTQWPGLLLVKATDFGGVFRATTLMPKNLKTHLWITAVEDEG